MKSGVPKKARIHVSAIEMLLEHFMKDGNSLRSNGAPRLSDEILREVEALRYTCPDGEGFKQSPTNHQRCSRLLLDTLQGVVDSNTWIDRVNTDLERDSRLALEAIHAIRECIPRIDMLVGTLAQGASERVLLVRVLEETAQAQPWSCWRLQRALALDKCPPCAPAPRFRRPGTPLARLPPNPSAGPRSGHARLEAPPQPVQGHVGTPHPDSQVCPPCVFGHRGP